MPDHEAVCDGVEDFYRQMREMALSRGTVVSKHVGGMVPDNSKGMVGGVRKRIAEKGKIDVNKDLSPDFYLAIKSVGMFTALLPTLTNRFHSFAIVRNPLAIRASVASVKSNNKARKNPPSLVRYDPDMNTALRNSASANTDPVEKWLLRMDYIFQRYAQELPAENVIRYEDIVSSGGKALQVIVPEAAQLDEPLDSKNLNPVYDQDVIRLHGERLLKSEGAYWNFYSREDVEEILDGLV
jgi:ribosome-associated protein YbcJ (S4-like RNA binding protein)